MGAESRGPADPTSCQRRWLRFCTWQVPSTQPTRRSWARGLRGPKCRRGPSRRGRPVAGARLALLCGWRAWCSFQTTRRGAGCRGFRPPEGVLAGGSLQRGMEEVNLMAQPFGDPPQTHPLSPPHRPGVIGRGSPGSLWSSGLGSWLSATSAAQVTCPFTCASLGKGQCRPLWVTMFMTRVTPLPSPPFGGGGGWWAILGIPPASPLLANLSLRGLLYQWGRGGP